MDHRRWARRVAQSTWARIGVSKIHGVGVVALRLIPKGTTVFRYREKFVALTSRELRELFPHPAVRKLIGDFSPREDGRVQVARDFPCSIDIGSYMNTSANPNMALVETKNEYRFVAKRRIKTGEELTWAYPL